VHSGATTKDRITCVLSITRKRETGGVVFIAFRVLTAANQRRTFARSAPVNFDALVLTITDKVCIEATAENGVAFVNAISWNRDACNTLTDGMFDAVCIVPTFILSCSIHSDAGIALTLKMFVGAIRVIHTFIIARTINADAGFALADTMRWRETGERLVYWWSFDMTFAGPLAGDRCKCMTTSFGTLKSPRIHIAKFPCLFAFERRRIPPSAFRITLTFLTIPVPHT
jgi:hypothetical protein